MLCMFNLPITINKIKKEFRDMYYETYNSWKLTFILPIFYFCFAMVFSTVMILINLIIFSYWFSTPYNTATLSLQGMFANIEFIQWVEIFFYLGYAAILSIAFSFFFNWLIKDRKILIIVISIWTLYSLLFSGFLPINQFKTEIAFDVLSYLSFFRYVSFNGFIDTFGYVSFAFKHDFVYQNIKLINHLEMLMNFTIPFILITIFINMSSMKFRWFKDVEIKRLNCYEKAFKQTSKVTYIIYMTIIIAFFPLLIYGIVNLIKINYASTFDFLSIEYQTGSLFVMLTIITYSICAGMLVKSVYNDKEFTINKQLIRIFG